MNTYPVSFNFNVFDDNMKTDVVAVMNARLAIATLSVKGHVDCRGCIDPFYSDIVKCFRNVCKLCVPKKGGMNTKNDVNMKSVPG